MILKQIQAAVLIVLGIIAGSVTADAQQGGHIKRVGFVAATPPVSTVRQLPSLRAFLQGLRELGYEEGRNIAMELRSAEGRWEHLPDVAAELVGLKVDVLLVPVCGAPLNAAMRATSTMRYRLPAIHPFQELVVEGGLISYGIDLDDLGSHAADQIVEIFRGGSPASIPVVQPTKFSLVVNIRAAKAIGLVIPETFLIRADEVIE